MDELSEEERAIVGLVREFTDRDVRPVASELEHANTYPERLIEQMKQLGIFGLAIPEPWGAGRVSTPCYALVTEELARGWMSLAGAMGGPRWWPSCSWTMGPTRQKERYLPRMGGRGRDPGHHGAHRAGRRLRPAGHAHERPSRRGFLRGQRNQDVDY